MHVWRAWDKLPDAQILYGQLHRLAEKIEIQREVFSADERLLARKCLISGLNAVLAVLRHDLQNGQVNVGFEKIMQQAGFKEDSAGKWKIQATPEIALAVPSFFLPRVAGAILTNQDLYQRSRAQSKAFETLMERQPAVASWAERFTGKADVINQQNEQLLAAQKAAVRPVFVPDLRGLQALPQVDSLLSELQDKRVFQEGLRSGLVEYWEKSGGQGLDMGGQEGINLVRSAVGQIIQDRQLDPDLLTGSDKSMLANFVGEVFIGLSRLGLAAGQQQEPEPERKRKLKR